MRFKTTLNIFKDFDEYFDPNWMDSDKLVLPPKRDWDYAREMHLEDVDLWEVIAEAGGGWGVYASWSPYAEFYLIRTGWQNDLLGKGIEVYYGAGAQKSVQKRIKELGFNVHTQKHWVEPENMWLYE
jgi:hypothetical protein